MEQIRSVISASGSNNANQSVHMLIFQHITSQHRFESSSWQPFSQSSLAIIEFQIISINLNIIIIPVLPVMIFFPLPCFLLIFLTSLSLTHYDIYKMMSPLIFIDKKEAAKEL